MNRRRSHRRAFLRGVGGVAVGLPFLEALSGRKAWAAPPKRLAIVFQCNGVNMDRFWPTAYGPITAASLAGTALEPLSKHAAKLLVPRGIHMAPRGYQLDGVPGCDHQKGMGCKLTCRPLPAQNGYPKGPSFDYVMAKAINPGGKDPLNLSVGGGGGGPLSSAFYTGSGLPAPMQRDPWKAFSNWMGAGTATGAAAVDLAALRRKSVLDVVKEDLDGLRSDPVLGASDKRRLDLHLTALRGLETAMTGGGGAAVNGCRLPDVRTREIQGHDGAYERVGAMMMDIMGIAMACDYNRVTTVQFGTGAGGPIYRWLPDELNRQYNHHKLSHGATSDGATSPNLPTAQWKTALFNIDTWHMRQMNVLLDRLAGYSEPGGSVLDNTVVLYINELSNGQQHNFADLPIVLAGSGGGVLKQGQFLKVTNGATSSTSECPSNQLFVSLAGALGYRDAQGAPMSRFGAPGVGKDGDLAALRA